MADLQTTIGADLSALDVDLRSALAKQERYARRLEAIDDHIIRHARRNADTLRRETDSVDRATKASLGGLATRADRATVAFRQMGFGGLTAAAAVFAAGRSIASATREYGQQFDFAHHRLEALNRQFDRAKTSWTRDIFDLVIEGGSDVASVFDGVAAAFDRAAAGLVAFANAAADPDRGFGDYMRLIAADDEAARSIEAQDRSIRSTNAARPLRAQIDRDAALARGDRLGAIGFDLNREQLDRFGQINAVEGLDNATRAGLLAEVAGSFDRRFGQALTVDQSERFEADARRRAAGFRARGGDGEFEARGLEAQADAEARARALLTQNLSPSELAAEREAIAADLERRLETLRAEYRLSRELLDLDRKRAEALGLFGEDRDAALRAIEFDRERARARASGLDPERLGATLAGIDAEERARETDDLARRAQRDADAIDRKRRGREEAEAILEDLRIQGLRDSGRTREAEEAEIRRRYGDLRGRITGSLSPEDAAPFVEQLGKRMAEELARVGDGEGRTVSGPVGAASFRGAGNAIGGQQLDMLRRIEKNTSRTITVSGG